MNWTVFTLVVAGWTALACFGWAIVAGGTKKPSPKQEDN